MKALIEELRARHVILPAVSTLERLGWETRRRAQQQVFTTLTEGLSEEQRKQLDALLVVPTDGRRTPLAWLREPPGPAKPSSFLKVIERLHYIRAFGLDPLRARRVHANRLRRLAPVHCSRPYQLRLGSGLVARWQAPGLGLLTYRGHTDLVLAVAWSPDGTRIASAGSDDTVQVWDAETGKHILTYRGHSGTIEAVAWSPDGRYLASGSWDTTVQVWKVTTGQRMLTYRGHADIVGAVAWSPDGKRIASAADDVRIWQAF